MSSLRPFVSLAALRRQRGVSLIEVLVAIVVLSLGVLAMAGLQLSSLRTSTSALHRSHAATLAADMAERIRANLPNASNYVLAVGAAAPSAPSNLHQRDLVDWRSRLLVLPAGTGGIAVDLSNERATITVQWDDRRGGGSATEQYQLTVRLWAEDLP